MGKQNSNEDNWLSIFNSSIFSFDMGGQGNSGEVESMSVDLKP